jgi:subtilisin family serine protease/PKD repeat protein
MHFGEFLQISDEGGTNVSRLSIWRRGAIIGAIAVVLVALGVSAAPNLPSVSRAPMDSEEFLPVSRGYGEPEYVDDEIIVKLKPMISMHYVADMKTAVAGLHLLNTQLGAEIIDSMRIDHETELFLVRVPARMTVDEAVVTYKSSKFVEYAEPNYLWYPEAPVFPNDLHFWRLWGMHNTGQDFYPGIFWEQGIPGADISAPEAWGVRTDASSVLVAVIDTGIDVYHMDLMNNIWINEAELNGEPGVDDDGNGYIDDIYGWDFANDDNTVFDSQAADRHGTHCAGTIGAEGNNGIGVAGVAWKAKIMSCKFIHGQSGSTWNAIKAINYASMMGAKIASNSWGGGGYSEALEEAIARSGMLFIASAGNDAADNDVMPHYPSSYDLPNVISVAASDWNDNLAGFSCYGPESVDLAAPGYWIISAYANAGYIWMGGTSMATPHVTGAAALVSAEHPDIPLYPGAEGWSEGQLTIKDILLLSVDRNPAFAGRMTSGGRLNVGNAIKMQFPIVIESAAADVTFGSCPLAVNFSAQAENPATVAQCWWSFGDGSDYDYSYNTSHTYTEEGAYLAWFNVLSHAGVQSKWPVQVVVANPGTIVYVDDDGGFDFEEFFLAACDQAGFDCVVVDSRYPLGLPDDFSDRLLVWNTALSWSDTLLPDQEEFLAGFLDNGGRLVMISPEYLYDLGELTPLAEEYLHVSDYVDNIPMGQWDGIDGDPITHGMSIIGNYQLGLEDALWPDLNARQILESEFNGYQLWPALRYADETYRVVFTTVPWEELPLLDDSEEDDAANPDPNNSAYFLTKTYDYLMGEINIPPTIGKVEANTYFAEVGETITFSADAHDVDGDELTYTWEFDSIENPPDGQTIEVAWDEPGVYEVILTVTDDGGEWTKASITVSILNPGAVVFVDDDDSDGDTEDYFFNSFDAIGQDYLSVIPKLVIGENGAKTGLERFRVVWNCGELGGLNQLEQMAVADLLDKGGSLFLAGQEVMFELAYKSANGMDFARNYLHVTAVEHDVGTQYVEGVENDPITMDARIYLEFPPGFDDWTDSLEIDEEAKAIFFNDKGRPCALRYTGDDHRLVFMAVAFEAFPFEPVEEPGFEHEGVQNGVPSFGAADLLANVLVWLTRPTVVVTQPVAGQVCVGATTIGWEAIDPMGEDLSIDIEYSTDSGNTWATLVVGEENDGVYIWDVSKLNHRGLYVIRVTALKPDGFSGSGVSDPFVVSVVGTNQFVAGPVPASDVLNFYINASGGATLYVYDMAGRLVFSQELTDGQFFYAWPLVNNAGKPLANGLYLCYMVTADGTKSDIVRLVISR